jgi:WD40 repeat protein
MIFKVENKEIRIWDFANQRENRIQFNEQTRVLRISTNSSGDKIAVLGETGQGDSKLYIFDLKTSDKIFELNVFCDFQWCGSDSILFSDGKSVRHLSLETRSDKELVKFSRIKMGPIELTLSPDLKRLAFVKWKGDDKKICVYDFNSSAITQFKPSLYRYTWLDNEKLIYNLGGGLKVLETSNGKSSGFIKNITDLENLETQNEKLRDILNIIRAGNVTINEISNPRFINERLYFKVFVVTKTEKRIGVTSIKRNSSDIKFHFYSNTGLIDDYYVMNNPEIIGVNIKPNTLIGEKFEPEVLYFEDNEKLEFKGYRPVWNSYMPT